MNTVKNIISVEGKKAQGVNNRLLPPVTSCCFFCLVFGSAVHNVFGSKKKFKGEFGNRVI